jgi:DNA helicase MCM8
LAQARARLELREEVTVNDANDVVQLLQESLLDAFTTETGEMEFSSRKGGISTAKSIKSLIKLMTREAAIKGSNIFSKYEISEYVSKLKLDKDVDTLIESMRTECYLLLKGPKLYGLNTV